MTRIVKIFVLILSWVVILSAHDLSFHMSLGARTFDVWKEFDHEFYQDISGIKNSRVPEPGLKNGSFPKRNRFESALLASYLRAQGYQLTIDPSDPGIKIFFNGAAFANDSTPSKRSYNKAMVYTCEFLGTGFVTCLPSALLFAIIMDNNWNGWGPPDFRDQIIIYPSFLILNSLLGSGSTWAIGKAFGQKGSWVKSLAGAGIGTLLGILVIHNWKLAGEERYWGTYRPEAWVVFFTAPPLGAVIGYNL